MNWRDHLTVDPAILAGKPVIRGTRLSVDFILGLLGEGWDQADILRNYPGIPLVVHPAHAAAGVAAAAGAWLLFLRQLRDDRFGRQQQA